MNTTIKVSKEFRDHISTVSLGRETAEDTLRRLLGLEPVARNKGGRPRKPWSAPVPGKYDHLDTLGLGDSVQLDWERDGFGSATNANALRVAVSRSMKRTGATLYTEGRPFGLLVTRVK